MGMVGDASLAALAARMSCDAMKELSSRDYKDNLSAHMHALTEPPCDLAFGFADRYAESLLQKGAGMMRNTCIEKLPAYQRGPWEKAFAGTGIAQPVQFEQWTRARSNGCSTTPPECPCEIKGMRFI